MTDTVIDLAERNQEIEVALAEFHRLGIGESVVYHSGIYPSGPVCRAALRADEIGIAALFRRPTGTMTAGMREFDFILIRCSAKAHAALRYDKPFHPHSKGD